MPPSPATRMFLLRRKVTATLIRAPAEPGQRACQRSSGPAGAAGTAREAKLRGVSMGPTPPGVAGVVRVKEKTRET